MCLFRWHKQEWVVVRRDVCINKDPTVSEVFG